MRAIDWKLVAVLLTALGVTLACSDDASAQTFTLTVDPASFSYPSADPDISPTVTSPVLTVNYRVRFNAGRPWVITVRATGDLVSGGESIPCANITWTAAPAPPFVNGTLSTIAQTLASGTGNINPARNGSLTFTLKNLWTYRVGIYTHTLVFTLATP
jgi:hypothetical protein